MDITTSLKMDVNRPRVRADKDREVYWSEAAGAIVMITEVPVLLGKTLRLVLAKRVPIGRGRFGPGKFGAQRLN
jgi:hypothetical protein